MTDHDLSIARHHIGCFANGQPDADFCEWARDALPAILEELMALQGADAENDKLNSWMEDAKEEVQSLKDDLREARQELSDTRKQLSEAEDRAYELSDELERLKHAREKATPVVSRKIAQDFRDDLEGDAIPPIVPPSPQPKRSDVLRQRLQEVVRSGNSAVLKISGDDVEVKVKDVPDADAPRQVIDKVFSTGDVARFCQVASRTVSKWFDSGRLGGYRVPGSHDRRIPATKLVKFMKENGMPVPEELYEKGE